MSNTKAATGDFQELMNAYSINGNGLRFTSAPLYFVRTGAVYQDNATYLLSAVGGGGNGWSSTASSSVGAYDILFGNGAALSATGRRTGMTVRCIAR